MHTASFDYVWYSLSLRFPTLMVDLKREINIAHSLMYRTRRDDINVYESLATLMIDFKAKQLTIVDIRPNVF